VFGKGLEYIPEGTRQKENPRELTSLSVLAFAARKVTGKGESWETGSLYIFSQLMRR
jgi:hypothetical protein